MKEDLEDIPWQSQAWKTSHGRLKPGGYGWVMMSDEWAVRPAGAREVDGARLEAAPPR